MKYFYRTKEEVKAGDICFYTESNGKDFHYANSICRIVEVDGDLHSQTIYWSDNDGMSFNKETDEATISLYWCAYLDTKVLQHFMKIDENCDFNKEYGRRGQIKKINKLIKDYFEL